MTAVHLLDTLPPEDFGIAFAYVWTSESPFPQYKVALSDMGAGINFDPVNQRISIKQIKLGDGTTFNANPAVGDAEHWLEIANNPATGAGKQFMRLIGYAGNTGYGNNIHFERAGGTEAAPTAVPNVCYLMSLGFRGYNGTNMSDSKAAFQVITTEAWTGSANGCKFRWEVTANGSTTRVLGMELSSSGLAVDQMLNARRVVGAVSALTDGATIAVNAALGNAFRVTLAGNRTLANPTNLVDGQQLLFRIKQDATGSRTLAYGSKYKFPGGAPALSTAANALDVLSCQYDATDDTLICVLQKAFA